MSTTNCPCGEVRPYSECCEPVIRGKRKAATAEELLRARYTAFAKHETDFVIKTHHSKTAGEVKREEIDEWAKGSEWLGLKIVQKEAGTEKDDKGTIIFCAGYKEKKNPDAEPSEHWEQAFFEKEGGDWKFYDARGVHTGTYRREAPKTGRNDPCTCGSGKKFKKCHGVGATV